MTKRSKLLSQIAAIAFAAMAWTTAASADTGNLLVNGNASGGLQGWTTTDSYWKTATAYDKVTPYDAHFFYPQGFKGKDGASTRIYQDVDIRNYAGTQATLSAYVRTWDTANTDESVLLLEFFDTSGKLLDKGAVSKNSDPTWQRIGVSHTIPTNAARARVSLQAVYHYGSEVDAYFDNVTLTAGGTPRAHFVFLGDPTNPSAPQGKTPSAPSSGTPSKTPPPPSDTSTGTPSNSQSDEENDGTMMVVYLKKGDYLRIGAFVDGAHYENYTWSVKDRLVDPAEPTPEHWLRGNSKVVSNPVFSAGSHPNYGPGWWLEGTSKGEAVVTVLAKSKKTHQNATLQLRVIVVK